MIIRHKGIWSERYEDAPFIGALISSIDCNFNCSNCFNQHIKNNEIFENTSEEIINIVKSNIFNKGIILAGLEWTLQPIELYDLIQCALINNLDVILYTGLNEYNFKQKFKNIYKLHIYIKFGRYEEGNKCTNNYMYGVKLSSSNQHIRGKDFEN